MDTSRRRFLQISSLVGGTAVLSPLPIAEAAAGKKKSDGTISLPELPISDLASLKSAGHKPFNYPDKSSPCIALWLDTPVAFGAGSEKRVVAYSMLCTHQGCPVNYDPNQKVFKCPCHFSKFDAEKSGQMICGQATTSLPLIDLHVDETSGKITAIGVQGLIYGRTSNHALT